MSRGSEPDPAPHISQPWSLSRHAYVFAPFAFVSMTTRLINSPRNFRSIESFPSVFSVPRYPWKKRSFGSFFRKIRRNIRNLLECCWITWNIFIEINVFASLKGNYILILIFFFDEEKRKKRSSFLFLQSSNRINSFSLHLYFILILQVFLYKARSLLRRIDPNSHPLGKCHSQVEFHFSTYPVVRFRY